LTLVKKIPPKRSVRKKKDQEAMKTEAVEAFIMLGGNMKATAIALGMHRSTLIRWSKTEWWKNIYDDVKQQDNIVLSLRLQKIVARSLDLVEDRLEKGDFFYDQKTGQVVRKEVSLRDAHAVFKDSFIVKESIEKPQTALTDQSSIGDKLLELAKQFETFASQQKAKPKVEVTDVIFLEEQSNES
jgi:hypothetical protein